MSTKCVRLPVTLKPTTVGLVVKSRAVLKAPKQPGAETRGWLKYGKVHVWVILVRLKTISLYSQDGDYSAEVEVAAELVLVHGHPVE